MNSLQSITSWVKTKLFKIISFSLFAIALNRLFVLVFWVSIWSYPWIDISWLSKIVTLWVYGLFLVIFPILYVRELKTILTIGTIKSLWNENKVDVADTVVEKVCDYCVWYTWWLSEWVKSMTTNVDHLFDSFPRIARKAFKKVQESIPLVDEVLNILRRIDLDTIWNSKQLKSEVMWELEPFLDKDEWRVSLFPWWTFVVNVLLMVFVFLVVKWYFERVVEFVMKFIG